MSFKLLSRIAIATSLAFGIAAQATEFRSAEVHPDDYPTTMAVKQMSD
jgi:TRAP-type C4-dicarboxylate transport system substrate-binding protein